MEVKEKIQNIIRNVTNDETLELHEDMTEDDIENYDSLSHIDTILRIEDEMDIRFTPDEIESSKNIGDFIKIVEDKL